MKFLFYIDEVWIGDLARRVQEEGHDVRCFFKYRLTRDALDGFVEKTDDWRPFAQKRDWIKVFEDTKRGRTQDALRRKGHLVIGGSAKGERLELDRDFGHALCEKIGLPVVAHHDFRDFPSAVAFVEENPRRWVIKKSGRVNNRTVDYKGFDPSGSDVLVRLRFLKTHWNPRVAAHFQLQEFIEGVEVAVGAWFNGQDWVMPYNVNFEHQPLMSGEVGPNTGEMYNTMWFREDRANRIFQETLEPMTAFFREAAHVGYVDLNGIVNQTGFHPLEWTVRFGTPAAMLQYRLMAGKIGYGDFLKGLASGILREHPYTRGYCVGAVVAASPFPSGGISAGLLRRNRRSILQRLSRGADFVRALEHPKFSSYAELARGVPIFLEEDADLWEALHLFEVKRNGEMLVTTGADGYVFIVTDIGSTPEEAGQKALAHIKKIHGFPWLYRNDLGVGESAKISRLAKYGYHVGL